MDLKTGIIILGEIAFTGALIYLYTRENKVLEFENRVIKRLKASSERRRQKKLIKKQNRINKKALYVPVKANGKNSERRAA